jgi:predicted TIM-barrel fold metal-dependent hydrolase
LNASNFADLPVIDGHIHYGHPSFMPGLMKILDRLRIPRLNVVCTPHQSRLSLVPDALHLKAHYPDRVYVFGGLDISALFVAPEQAGSIFADYVDTLLALGCDGVKMIEGKPDIRRMLPIPSFDSQVYAPYWARLVERKVPLIFHVNDPEEFWDPVRIPDWARERGWFYGDADTIDNETQYAEVLNVLERYPDLNVIFAHFFFLSAQLPRLAEILDRYPNVCVDLTPGIEMYHSFSAAPDTAREFFLKYQDRIVYGTDIGAKALLATPEEGIEMGESQARAYVVRAFLETESEFWIPEGNGFLFGHQETPFRGIALPRPVLEKIYAKNFERIAGSRPRDLDPAAIVAECERLTMMLGIIGAAQPELMDSDPSVAQMVKSFFLSKT